MALRFLNALEPAIIGAGLILIFLLRNTRKALNEPEPEIIPLPEGDYMAEGWHTEGSFRAALRKFMLEKEGFANTEADWFLDTTAICYGHRTVIDLCGEHYFAPTVESDRSGFKATIARFL